MTCGVLKMNLSAVVLMILALTGCYAESRPQLPTNEDYGGYGASSYVDPNYSDSSSADDEYYKSSGANGDPYNNSGPQNLNGATGIDSYGGTGSTGGAGGAAGGGWLSSLGDMYAKYLGGGNSGGGAAGGGLGGMTGTGSAGIPSATDNIPAPPVSVAGCIGGSDFACRAEAALVNYTNAIRQRRGGKAPLAHNQQADAVARDWSVKQGGSISHTGFPSARTAVFKQMFPSVPVPAMRAENVAMNQSGGDPDRLAKAFADQWEKSPGHLANILGNYGAIGVGVHCASTTGRSRCVGTQIFLK
jgi:uncharacterized protein YkwD